MDTERETQIHELLAANPQYMENTVSRLHSTLKDAVVILHIYLFPIRQAGGENDVAGHRILEKIVLKKLIERNK